MRDHIVAFVSVFLLCSVAWGQASSSTPASNSGTNQQSTPRIEAPGMSGHDMSNMKDMPMGGDKDSDASAHAMHSREGHRDRGWPMRMTSLPHPSPADPPRPR